MKCGAGVDAGEEDGSTRCLQMKRYRERGWTQCQEAMGQDPRVWARNREKAEGNAIPIVVSKFPMIADVWDPAKAPAEVRVKVRAKVRVEALARVAEEEGNNTELTNKGRGWLTRI